VIGSSGDWKAGVGRRPLGESLKPRIIQPGASYCNVGEISDSLRKVVGEYNEAVVIGLAGVACRPHEDIHRNHPRGITHGWNCGSSTTNYPQPQGM